MANLMKLMLKNTAMFLAPRLSLWFRVGRCLVDNESSYLQQTGWVRSFTNKVPQDNSGNPLPWLNLSVISLLKTKLKPNLSLFEFGSGYSTLFYAGLVNTVVSVEGDKAWHRQVTDSLPENARVDYLLEDVDGEYCRHIHRSDTQFDVVVIDGRDRVNCLRQSIACVSLSGVIILDDSQRYRYQDAFKIAEEAGFRHISLEGIKPTDFETHTTTLFYRDGNCFGL